MQPAPMCLQHLVHRQVHMLPVPRQHPKGIHQLRNVRDTMLMPGKLVLAAHAASQLTAAQLSVDSRPPRQPGPTQQQVAIKRAAKSARMSGQPQLALKILLEGVEHYPQDYHLVAAAASTAAKLGDVAHALQILSAALQEQPHNVHLLTAAAKAYAGSGNPAAARRCLQTAAAAQPSNAVVLQAWGVLEASCGNLDTAVNLYRQAVAADPSHVPVYVAWAQLEAGRGRVREARSLHQQGHQANTPHVPNLHAWADLECGEGQWLLGIKLLQAALQANQKHLPSWMALGKAHWALGDSASARRVYQAACKALGPVPQLLNQWATLEQQAQRIPAARAVMTFMDTALAQQHQQQHPGGVAGQQSPAAQQQQQQQQEQEQLQQQQPPAGRQRRMRQKAGQPQQQPQPQQPTGHQRQEEKQNMASMPQAESISQRARAGHGDSLLQQQHGLLQPGVGSGMQRTKPTATWTPEMPRGDSTFEQQSTDTLPEHLEQQLQHLVAWLDAQGPKGRAPSTSTAATAAVLQPGPAAQLAVVDSSSRQSTPGIMMQQQQQDHQPQQLQQQTTSGSSASSNSGSHVMPSVPVPPTGLTSHVPALVNTAVMEQRAGNTAKALKLFEAALQTEPNNPKLLHALAQLHLKRGDRAAAEAQLQSLERCDPGNGFLCHSRGVLAQQEGQLGEAKEWFVRGTKALGSEAALLNYEALAELQVFMGDASGARATLAAGLGSRRPTARFLRMAGLVEKRLGSVERAAQLLARAVAKAPRDYRSWLAWAVLERRRGDFAAAARCFKRGTACAPCNPHMWYAWAAMTWRDCRDFRAARRLYEQATTYCPRNAPLWMEWAMLEWDEAGNADRARQLFQAGADVPHSYQHPPLYQAWAQREAAAGNAEVAERLKVRSVEVAMSVKRVARLQVAGRV